MNRTARFVCPGPVFGLRWSPPDSRHRRRACGVRFVHPERVCGTWGALRMPFSHLRGALKPPHCSGGFTPPVRFSSAGAIRASRMGLRDELRRSPGTGLPASRTDLRPQTSRASKSFTIHCYEKRSRKSFGISSYAIVGLKVPWNEYLQKKGGWGPGSSRFAQIRTVPERSRFRKAKGDRSGWRHFGEWMEKCGSSPALARSQMPAPIRYVLCSMGT